MKDNILGKHYNTFSLLKYTLPTILMMIFQSTYVIIDGIFIAKYVGEDALAAINLILPVFNLMFAFALMIGTGSVAIVSKFMGQGENEKARGFLSTTYIVGAVAGLSFTAIGFLIKDPTISFLGGEGALKNLANDYFVSIIPFALSFTLQVFVQNFFVASGKPTLGFGVCLLGGLTNILLDYLFISPNLLNLGIVGAGLATGIGATLPAIFGLFYFAINRKNVLYFAKPLYDFKLFVKGMYNGSSEMVSNLSVGLITFLFNVLMLKHIGDAGVAAISVILYIQMFQMAIYFGYSIGVSPIISFKFGAKDRMQLKQILRSSFLIISIFSIVVVLLSIFFADFAVGIFIDKASDTFILAQEGFILFSFAYLFIGINVYMSALFTALNNGLVSSILSFIRTLGLTVLALLFLPLFFGVTGIWLAVPVAEFLMFFFSFVFYLSLKKKYGY